MYDKRYQHLRLVVVQKTAAYVLEDGKRFTLEVFEVFFGVLCAPLLLERKQLCGELLVGRVVFRQEL